MDVVCERCKAEYEFDDALVSERGTTVKCTNCSHQFKIFRPTSESDAAKVWNLRRPDGTVIPFDSLAVLQKWILEGKVSKMDEISRAGEAWKSLGAIAELESFFATAELRASQNAPGRAGQRFPSMNGVRAPTPAPGTASRSNPASSTKTSSPALSSPTIRPGGAAPPPPPPVALRAPSQGGSGSSGLRAPSQGGAVTPGLRAPSQGGTPPPVPTGLRGPSGVKPAVSTMVQIPPPPKMPTEMGPPSSPLPAADRHEPLVDEVERARPRSVPPKVALPPLPALTTPPRDLVDDQAPTRSMNSDVKISRSAPPPPERRSGLVLGLIVGAVIAAIAVGVSWQMGALGPGNTATATNNPRPATDTAHRDAIIARSTEKTRRYSAAAFDEAREELNTAVTLNPADAVLTATRAEVLAAWSEMLAQQADDLEVQAAAPGADVARLRAEADLLRRESGTRKERARSDLRTAEGALGTVPAGDRPLVEARLADAARIVGESSVAAHLEAARRTTPTAESSLYLALASIGDDPTSAAAGLRAALSSEAQNQRARVALARLLKRQGDARGARELLDEGLRADASHEAMLGLSRSLGAVAAVSVDGGAAAVDAGPTLVAAATPPAEVVPAAAPPTPPSTATPIVIPAETPRHTGTAPELGGPLPQGYDRLVQSGDQLQHAGRSALARERYQAALAARPGGSEALTGLGYVELDVGAVGAAISRFRQALASNSRYSEAYIGLGEAYSHQRSYPQAVQAYQQYLEVNPGGSRAEMARRQIESLQERISSARAPESADADAATSP